MKKLSVIYQITSKINKKKYVGSAINFPNRIRQHLSELRLNRHGNPKLQAHFNKYGIEDLQFSILEPVMFPELLIQREQYHIDTLKPIFNVCQIAGSSLGYKHSEESKKKFSESRKGVKMSEETKKKMSESHKGKNTWSKGRHLSDEHKQNISKANKGEKNYIFGKHHSEEAKKKMSESAKKREISGMKGNHHSEETKKKIGEANRKIKRNGTEHNL
jgi:hypothetical protein